MGGDSAHAGLHRRRLKGLCPELRGGGWQDVQVVQVGDEPGGPAAAVARLPHLHTLHEGLMSQPAVGVGLFHSSRQGPLQPVLEHRQLVVPGAHACWCTAGLTDVLGAIACCHCCAFE